MSDLLYNVTLLRKSLQKKRQLKNKELNLNFPPLNPFESDRSKTERNNRNRLNQEKSLGTELSVKSPVLPKRFEFMDSLASPESPARVRAYKLDAAILLVSRVKRFLNKHFLIWKKNADSLKDEENNMLNKAWRFKVNVARNNSKNREVTRNSSLAGKIVRNSQDFPAQAFPKSINSAELNSEEELAPVSYVEKRKQHASLADNLSFLPQKPPERKKAKIQNETKMKFGKIMMDLVLKKKSMVFKGIRVSTPCEKEKTSSFESEYSKKMSEYTPPEKTPDLDRQKIKGKVEGYIQNIQNYINQARERKSRKSVVKTETQQKSIEKIFKLIKRSLLKKHLKKLKIQQKSLSSLEIEKNSETAISVTIDSVVLSEKKTNNEKTLRIFVKNLNKDVVFRKTACFKLWNYLTKSYNQEKEINSLTAVNIHNLLLSVINCRTKLFFSNYSLALQKFNSFRAEFQKKIGKGLQRLRLVLRDKKLEPFARWKAFCRNIAPKFSLKKKCMSSLNRVLSIQTGCVFRDAFSTMLVYVKLKKKAVVVISRFFADRVKAIFTSFSRALSQSKYYSPERKIPMSLIFGPRSSNLQLKSNPRKFTFKYLCYILNRLSSNLWFHHNSLKKNVMIKWKVHCINLLKLESIKLRYKKDVNHTLSCSILLRVLNMLCLSSIRFSFIKLLKTQDFQIALKKPKK